MIEREMEDLLWQHTDKLLNEPLKQFRRQARSSVGRSDLVFTDRLGGLLVIEIKRGKLERRAVDQLHDYYGSLKKEFSRSARRTDGDCSQYSRRAEDRM